MLQIVSTLVKWTLIMLSSKDGDSFLFIFNPFTIITRSLFSEMFLWKVMSSCWQTSIIHMNCVSRESICVWCVVASLRHVHSASQPTHGIYNYHLFINFHWIIVNVIVIIINCFCINTQTVAFNHPTSFWWWFFTITLFSMPSMLSCVCCIRQ